MFFPLTSLPSELELCVVERYVQTDQTKLFCARLVCSKWNVFVKRMWMRSVENKLAQVQKLLLDTKLNSQMPNTVHVRMYIAELASYSTNNLDEETTFVISTILRLYAVLQFPEFAEHHRMGRTIKDLRVRTWLLRFIQTPSRIFTDFNDICQTPEHRVRVKNLKLELCHCIEQYQRRRSPVPRVVSFMVRHLFINLVHYEYDLQRHRYALLKTCIT